MRRVGALAADAVGRSRTRRQLAVFDPKVGGTRCAGSEHKEGQEQQGCNQQREDDSASGHLLMMPHLTFLSEAITGVTLPADSGTTADKERWEQMERTEICPLCSLFAHVESVSMTSRSLPPSLG